MTCRYEDKPRLESELLSREFEASQNTFSVYYVLTEIEINTSSY